MGILRIIINKPIVKFGTDYAYLMNPTESDFFLWKVINIE